MFITKNGGASLMKFELNIVRFEANDVITTSGPAACANPMECTCFNPDPTVVADVS